MELLFNRLLSIMEDCGYEEGEHYTKIKAIGREKYCNGRWGQD